MSLIARRLLGSLLIALVIAASFVASQNKPEKVAQPKGQGGPNLFIVANNLAADRGRLPGQVKLDGREVKLKRRGQYSRLCLNSGCALLKDYSPRFTVIIGPKAKEKIWERRR